MNIDFDTFKKHLSDVVNFSKLNDNIFKAVREYNENTEDIAELFLPGLVGNVVDLLEIMTNDTEDRWIGYWAFELDCGENYEDGMVTEENGDIIKLKTIEDLWELLKDNEARETE